MSSDFASNRTVIPIFLATIIIIFLLYTSIVFPALFSSIVGSYSDTINNPFEFGHQASILIISNIIILGFGFAYYKKKLPSQLQDIIERIRSFEISKKNTFVIFIIIMGIYIGISSPELFLNEKLQFDDYIILEEALELWPDDESDNPYIQEQNDRYVRMFLLDISLDVFQNFNFIPYVGLLLLTMQQPKLIRTNPKTLNAITIRRHRKLLWQSYIPYFFSIFFTFFMIFRCS